MMISEEEMLSISDMEYDDDFQTPNEEDLVLDKRKDLEDGESEGSRKKKKSRPTCSWVEFSRDFIKEYTASHPTSTGLQEATKAASTVWKLMSADEKAKYTSQTRELWDKYITKVRKPRQQAGLVTRCSPGRLLNVIHKLTAEQRDSVKSMGFGSILGLRCRTLRRSLCLWLLEKFNTLRRSLEIGGQHIPITPLDVELVMGITASGKDVVNSGPDDLVLELRQKYNSTNRGISVRLLEERLAAPEAGEDFKRSFVLYILGTLLCPTARLDVSPTFLHFLKNVDTIHEYNWGKFLLDRLVREVARFRQGKQRAVGGCLLFLQLFYYECVAVRNVRELSPVSFLCLYSWGEDEISEREKQEKDLGGYGFGEVVCKERCLGIGPDRPQNQVDTAFINMLDPDPQFQLSSSLEQDLGMDNTQLDDSEGNVLCGDLNLTVPVGEPCRNLNYGCTDFVDFVTRNNHEETCIYAPCACPLRTCDFMGSTVQLSLHFNSKHWDSGRRFQYDRPLHVSLRKNETFLVLQAEKDGIMFILNNKTENIGHNLMVTCICPSSSREQFCYDLASERGSSSLRLKSCAQNFPGRAEGIPLVDFLLVPFAHLNSSEQLDLEVCIWNLVNPIS